MHKAALTVNSIPKVPARIQQLFFNFAKSAKCVWRADYGQRRTKNA